MLRLCAFAAYLLLCAGCATGGQAHWYDEALKDARGDNMQMRGFGGGPTGARMRPPSGGGD